MQQLSIGHQSVSVALVTGMHNDTLLAMYPILHLSRIGPSLALYHHPLAIKSDIIGFITHLAGVVVLDYSVWSGLVYKRFAALGQPPCHSADKVAYFRLSTVNIPHHQLSPPIRS